MNHHTKTNNAINHAVKKISPEGQEIWCFIVQSKNDAV